jgi:hypothetical protein
MHLREAVTSEWRLRVRDLRFVDATKRGCVKFLD